MQLKPYKYLSTAMLRRSSCHGVVILNRFVVVSASLSPQRLRLREPLSRRGRPCPPQSPPPFLSRIPQRLVRFLSPYLSLSRSTKIATRGIRSLRFLWIFGRNLLLVDRSRCCDGCGGDSCELGPNWEGVK